MERLMPARLSKINDDCATNKKELSKISVLTPDVTKEQYKNWKHHRKNVLIAPPRVNDKAPRLVPEIYLKGHSLVADARNYHKKLKRDIELLINVNKINVQGGFVDCWNYPKNERIREKLRNERSVKANKIKRENRKLYCRLVNMDAVVDTLSDLNEAWKHTMESINLMGRFPFCLATSKPIDKGMVDPDFNYISGNMKYWMKFNAEGGILLGSIIIELFEDVCPVACKLFKTLVKGIPSGEAYSGTKIFMIVPDMFCSAGDVTKNNGFGGTHIEDLDLDPENYNLNHSIPGVISMDVYQGKMNGIFNMIFRPMPFLDGKAVVFGRIVGGNSTILECISGMGTPLGMTRGNPTIKSCGWIKKKKYTGSVNTQLTGR